MRATEVDRFDELGRRLTSSTHLARLLVLLGTVIGLDALGTRTFVLLLALAAVSLASILSSSVVDLWLRHPILALVDATLCVLLVVVSHGAPVVTFVPLVTAALVAVTLPLTLVAPVLAVLLVSLLVPILLAPQELGAWRDVLLAGLPATAVGLALVGAVGRWSLQEARRATGRAVTAQRTAAAAEQQAQLARDLHDGAGKSLHGIGLLASALGNRMEEAPDGQAKVLAAQLELAASTAANEVRSLLSGLRLGTSDLPLPELLATLAEEGEQAGLVVELQNTGPADLPSEVKREVWLGAREIVHNATKHARATTLWISLDAPGGEGVRLVVADDGVGLDPRRAAAAARRGHFGLQGLRERIGSVGGRVEIRTGSDTVRGTGTEVCIEVPL